MATRCVGGEFVAPNPDTGFAPELLVQNDEIAGIRKEIVLDGKKLNGNIIRPHRDGRVHKVEVLMGKPSGAKAKSSKRSMAAA